MIARQILSVGYDRHLLATRSMVLRHAGYAVKEALILSKALSELESDGVDAMLLCNSIPPHEQKWLATEALSRRRLLPIVCIHGYSYEENVPGCMGIDNDPESLLKAVEAAVKNGAGG